MKCDYCGRGFTFRRIARDAAFIVTRLGGPGNLEGELAERGRVHVCGGCMVRDVLTVAPEDLVVIILVDALGFKLFPAEPTESLRHRKVVHS